MSRTHLRRNGQNFELDLGEAAHLCVGSDAAAVFPADDGRPHEGLVVPLWTTRRADFIRELIRIWSGGNCALLAPSETLLERLQFQEAEALLPKAQLKAERSVQFRADAPLVEVLTSGTTGEPQLFRKTAAQLFEEALTLAKALGWGPEDTVLATTAPHHVYGLLFGILAPWAAGAKIVVDPKNEPGAFHPLSIASLIVEHGVTRLVTVPAHLRALCAAEIETSTVSEVISSAAPLDRADASAFEKRTGARVLDILGSTETGGIATRRPAKSAAWRPLPGVAVSTGNEEKLFITSPFTWPPHQVVETGERALIHGDGTFEHLGREDGVLKVGGKRISLQEITMLARALPSVRDAVALSRPVTGYRGQEVLLVVAGQDLSKAALKDALRQSLDPVFVPRRIRIVENMPFDTRGKLQRDVALALFETRAPLEETSRTPGANAPGEKVEIALKIASNSRRFEGHFDGDPLLPALAQLTDLILPAIRKAWQGHALLELSRVKWTKPIRPGSAISLSLERKNSSVRFELRQAGQLSCSGFVRLEDSPSPHSPPPAAHRSTPSA